jgi:hypothetical protein
MSEVLISPGVFLQENDLSQITQGPINVGAALVGPTVTGPVNVPTVVTTYSQYKSIFGAAFVSGGSSYEYLTSIAALNYFEQGGSSLLVTRVASGSLTPSTYTPATASVYTALDDTATTFVLETLSVGTVMNNIGVGDSLASLNGALPSGSSANVRWEIASSDSGSGLFTLVIRRGDDYATNKTILETWTNLSLDPNQANFISYVIGDQVQNAILDEDGNYFLQVSGSYRNQSKYVRVKSVDLTTPNYFDNQGIAKSAYTASLPAIGSGSSGGSFSTAAGTIYGCFGQAPLNMFESIPTSATDNTTNNKQGCFSQDYNVAISLLSNKDAYRFNTVYAPGITSQNSPSQVNSIVQLAQDRGDNIAVVDMVGYAQNISTVTSEANSYDNSYAATYWPWVQIRSRETGKVNFVPASTLIPAIYEYNDKVSAEWFAPAGLNRGGMGTVLQPERRLSVANRNTLYAGKVNPIAIFPGVGTVVYGQKTLQQKASALDRVNVRRLLIALKTYIGQIGETLVFEPNTQVTRNRFLNQVNPYLEYVQQRQGVYAFQVIMDETNNTPDVIDRNQLVGTIYIQPTRAAEFIYLNFNILPTGATFS